MATNIQPSRRSISVFISNELTLGDWSSVSPHSTTELIPCPWRGSLSHAFHSSLCGSWLPGTGHFGHCVALGTRQAPIQDHQQISCMSLAIQTTKPHHNNIGCNYIILGYIYKLKDSLSITCILPQCNLVIINLIKKNPMPTLFYTCINSFILLVQ